MTAARPPGAFLALRVLAPVLLHALARDVDAAAGDLLRSTLDLPGLVGHVLALLDPAELALRALLWTAAGAALWAALSSARARLDRIALRDALAQDSWAFAPLLIRPAITALALVSLALRPTYPYGFTLPVALGQDWSIAQDAATAAALLAWWWPRGLARVPAPGAVSVTFLAFVAYALLTPDWARRWEGHPGNEPKTLRMAVAIGHGLTLDVEGVSAAMEDLPTRPLAAAAADMAGTWGRESWRMLRALASGPEALGASAIRATRVTRQTIRGKDGGVYHVLAPGPSLLLAPALRADRALNLARGTRGRLALTVLFWNALAAVLVGALFRLARDCGAGAGPAAWVAGLLALLPPFVFYSFQFYPEMLGALVLALALHAILVRPWGSAGSCVALALLLATLPWLHQKFLPVWVVLAALAAARAVDALVPLRDLALLAVPQALSAALFVLYNFAITGSVRPDALFLAWGPAGVSSARWGQGLFGLLLDARYGLLPYVPVYLLAGGGALLLVRRAPRLRWALLPLAVYYLTVAAADNWSGAVCNLGRYVMPGLPAAAAGVAAVAALAPSRRGLLAVALTLTAWSGIVGVQLWRDPHAANDCALLLAKSAIADGNVYIPNLFIRTWADAAPGLWARIAAWLALGALLTAWIRRVASGRAGGRPARAVFGLAVVLLSIAALLERWPGGRTAARFLDAVEAAPETTVFVRGARVDAGRAWLRPGEHELLVRSREDLDSVRLRLEGEGTLRLPGRPPYVIPAAGLVVDLPLERRVVLEGRRGVRETLSRQRLRVDGPRPLAASFAVR